MVKEDYQTQDQEKLTGNNETIYRNDTVQKLTHEEILKAKEEKEGDEMVDLIKRNNVNFEQRFDISKKKYLDKKKKKYNLYFFVEECNLENVNRYFMKNYKNYYFEREDYLAYYLNLVHPQPNDNLFLAERTRGVIAAGLLSKMDQSNQIYILDTKKQTSKENRFEAVNLLGLNQRVKGMSHSETLDHFKENKREIDFFCTADDINLITLIEAVQPQMRDNCQLVMFGRTYDLLRPVYEYLMKNHDFININLTDYFMRDYQILPLRTHPEMKGNLITGFFLTAIKIGKELGDN